MTRAIRNKRRRRAPRASRARQKSTSREPLADLRTSRRGLADGSGDNSDGGGDGDGSGSGSGGKPRARAPFTVASNHGGGAARRCASGRVRTPAFYVSHAIPLPSRATGGGGSGGDGDGNVGDGAARSRAVAQSYEDAQQVALLYVRVHVLYTLCDRVISLW